MEYIVSWKVLTWLMLSFCPITSSYSIRRYALDIGTGLEEQVSEHPQTDGHSSVSIGKQKTYFSSDDYQLNQQQQQTEDELDEHNKSTTESKQANTSPYEKYHFDCDCYTLSHTTRDIPVSSKLTIPMYVAGYPNVRPSHSPYRSYRRRLRKVPLRWMFGRQKYSSNIRPLYMGYIPSYQYLHPHELMYPQMIKWTRPIVRRTTKDYYGGWATGQENHHYFPTKFDEAILLTTL